MADKTKNNNAGTTQGKRQTDLREKPKKSSGGKASPAPEIKVSKSNPFFPQLAPYILVVIALFLGVCFIFTEQCGIIGRGVTRLFLGLFSISAWLIPVFLLNLAFTWQHDRKAGNNIWKQFVSLIVLSLLSIISFYINTLYTPVSKMSFIASEVWERAQSHKGGGIVGEYLGWLFYKCFGRVGMPIIIIALFMVFSMFMFGLTPKDAWLMLCKKVSAAFTAGREKRALRRALAEQEYEEEIQNSKAESQSTTVELPPVHEKIKAEFDPDVPVGGFSESENADPFDISAFDIIKGEKNIPEKKPETRTPNLDSIFKFNSSVASTLDGETGAENSEDVEIEVERRQLISKILKDDEPKTESRKEYNFPPVTILDIDTSKKNTDISEELSSNARKLVETLASFKVRTKIVNVSRGPTITRYELVPEEGIRVRAIANLVDDIALNLATTGVRIEAPIPGKAAVGVEVPNKVRETVYLRSLLDDKRFEQSQAKLTAALGVDVAGDPIYMDVSKMPHLLIAGTTGSGKSVCMNCIILSILYKATPNEVKMIMIDPKKVEFNIYNGLPHLIVPVVSNTKKAAGALAWAVAEMERRYESIEAVGVRDIKNYNMAIKDDPDKDFMPQILIVIDELADLMMTAPDEVEESICRIAQKGRACGIHLLVGTQRPSVDVITGLIKANIPSRIAFTVSSQVDSRTIIDIAGAEKLIGRGDMLFVPVGFPKPMRVQGAFVSDSEVEAVTQFIIKNSGESEYDDKVMSDIEKEAEMCGNKGKKIAGDSLAEDDSGGESDPMLKAAIDLAVESGKISTSLIQRRLSLGYGRAAKLIDRMEKMGIVSAPEGQKPRNVLISANEWAQAQMHANE